ncbi:MAG: helix-turn-helix transcriptional regulator [Lachnospiraceae bacterium]|jgi:hypothetical protein|nr:helix-turn-helix transcriptional regulator [Lachnospiraceae bacterium]
MGRASTKENKSIYQITREELKLTREKASELIGYMSPERIEKIENYKVNIQPDDVMALADCYKAPKLCNYYCANECPIGQKHVPEIEIKDLAQITIETLNSLNKINREKDRLLEIIEDGRITDDELADFVLIKKTLDKISLSVDTLQLWVDQAIADGDLDESAFNI